MSEVEAKIGQNEQPFYGNESQLHLCTCGLMFNMKMQEATWLKMYSIFTARELTKSQETKQFGYPIILQEPLSSS